MSEPKHHSAPEPVPPETPALPAPSFYLTGRQPLRPGTILLATVAAVAALYLFIYIQAHTRQAHLANGSDRSGSAASGSDSPDEKDDPNQVDTIVLGDPADAPVPATTSVRRANRDSRVHPFVIVRLPRFGEQVGLIPDSPAGRLLYQWLAAFNQSNYAALVRALPTSALDSAAAAQLELRQQTGGFNLISAKEIQPGVLVFRLRDQTPESTEGLGTLQMRPGSNPPAIANFSLRAVPQTHRIPTSGAETGER